MPRASRKKSESGIYHVLIRGINRQDIFQDDEDKYVFLERLSRYKDDCSFQIYAYCLMSNHVHLLIRECDTQISDIMKRINTSYAYWFNQKYNRVGHLFQDRFRSEPVVDDRYLLTLIRYIHQNPVKIGLPISSWTSYNDYLASGGITDIAFVLDMFSNNQKEAIASFIKYVNERVDGVYLDTDEKKRITDKEAAALIMKIGKVSAAVELQYLDRCLRDTVLSTLKGEGLSVRQLERLTGINRGQIFKADDNG